MSWYDPGVLMTNQFPGSRMPLLRAGVAAFADAGLLRSRSATANARDRRPSSTPDADSCLAQDPYREKSLYVDIESYIGRDPIQVNDVAGLACLCHLLTL